MKKYKLLKSKEYQLKLPNGTTLYRIKALKDFLNVKKDSIGGYVESEKNLSHYDNCWIYEEAQVFGEALVYGKAQVYGKARVCGKAHVYGKALVYGEAYVFGEACVFGKDKITSKKDWLQITNLDWPITITKKYIYIGCQAKTHKDWFKVTKAEAVKLGCPKNKYITYKQLIKTAIKNLASR